MNVRTAYCLVQKKPALGAPEMIEHSKQGVIIIIDLEDVMERTLSKYTGDIKLEGVIDTLEHRVSI